jgi:hypothetical protein
MSTQALQEFIGRHMVSAGALTAVAAALDAKAGGAPRIRCSRFAPKSSSTRSAPATR